MKPGSSHVKMTKPPVGLFPCVIFAGVISLAVSIGGAAASSAVPPASEVYVLLEKFHGHVCAGSIFGARLGSAAREALLSAGAKGKLKARYYDLSCPVDGIQISAATTYGNKVLTVEDKDEHRLVLTAEATKQQVEARLTKKAEELGIKSRDLGKKAQALAEGSPERKHVEREIAEIFSWLKTAPTPEIVIVSPVRTAKR